jgi:MFS family permease
MSPIYPNLTSIPAILFVGLFEGALWAFTTPSMNSFLMDAVAERRAAAQGIVGTALSSAAAVGSLVGGALFALGVAIPFLAAAGAGIVFALVALPWMLSAGGRQPAAEGESA